MPLGSISGPEHLEVTSRAIAMPIQILSDTVDLVVKSGLREAQELIHKVREPGSVLAQEYLASLEHWRNDRQPDNLVLSRQDSYRGDTVALFQILNKRTA